MNALTPCALAFALAASFGTSIAGAQESPAYPPPPTYVAPQPPPTQPAPEPLPPPPPEPNPPPSPPETTSNEGVPARTGFQLAVDPSLAIPIGKVGEFGNTVGSEFGLQVPVTLDLGGRPTPHLYFGGFVGLGFGAAQSGLGTSFRIGADAKYFFTPAEHIDPWVGYGLGFEGESNSSTSVGGIEWAHIMGGLDFRISPSFGVGPFLDLSFGSYGGQSGASITHGWLQIGARLVLFP